MKHEPMMYRNERFCNLCHVMQRVMSYKILSYMFLIMFLNIQGGTQNDPVFDLVLMNGVL
jgi:hypothetical protein